jgi:hypothetical protein
MSTTFKCEVAEDCWLTVSILNNNSSRDQVTTTSTDVSLTSDSPYQPNPFGFLFD